MKKYFIGLLAILMVSCSSHGEKQTVQYQYIDDIRPVRVGAMMGSVHESLLEKRFPEMQIGRYETIIDLVMALKQNRVDAIGMDGYRTPTLNFMNGGGMVRLDDCLGTLGLAAAFPKGGNVGLRQQFNQFLHSIRESGEYDRIIDKWINYNDTVRMPLLQLPVVGQPFRVATCPTAPPTSFQHNGKSAGLDMELVQRFAIYINRPVEIQNLNFTSLITSLVTGKADMVMSALTATEERAKAVDFSDPYLVYDLDVLVRTTDKAGCSHTQQAAASAGGKGWWRGVQESFYNNLILEQRYLLVLNGLRTTLLIALLSAVFGTMLGAFVCFLKMRRSPLLRSIANVYINLMRGMPVLVLLLIMFYVVFNKVDADPVLVSVITFSMNFAAYASEMFRTSIEGVDRGQTEAGIALGFTRLQTFFHIILPQAFHSVLPVYKGEMISMVKMTSIVGYIAVEDLTRVSDIIRSRTFDAFFPLLLVAILYFVIAWLFTLVLDYAGRRL